jgi:ubiquinone/menaquinone biosynthesis C-methylase UbiE
MTPLDVVAAAYDAVYAGLASSATLQAIWREHALGDAYPEGFEHLSFVTAAELTHIANALRTPSGGLLMDVACGTGGPGLWVAVESGARLVGIDASRVAVAQARARAEQLDMYQRATFMVGRFDRLPVQTAAADAVVSIDALQYAPDKKDAFVEIARVLRPDGRLLFTAFEVHAERAAGLPVLGLDPVGDFRSVVEQNGFTIVAYDETAGWQDRVTSAYQAIRREQNRLVSEMGAVAATALAFEVSATLDRQIFRRRVQVIAARSGVGRKDS